MNPNNQDQRIYDRARKKVKLRNTFLFLVMCIYFITIFTLFQLKVISISHPNFSKTYLASSCSQICLFGIVFLLQSFGKKFFRFLYWIGWLYAVCLLYIPIYFLIGNLSNWMDIGIWFLSMIIELYILYKYGKSQKTNQWTIIFFDKEVELEEGMDENDLEKIYLDSPKEKMIHKFEVEEEIPYELPQLCLRLGICVYGSLMLFPILLQIGASLFASNDMQTVFATKDIFIFCILSAVIWTIPMFLYYYNHPSSRNITIVCICIELIRIGIYANTYIEYFQSHLYPIRVFIFFGLVEIIRYWLLMFSIHPIWKMEMPEMDDDDDEYE